jgi:hypothetical protein
MRRITSLPLLALLASLSGCGSPAAPIDSCVAVGELVPLCEFSKPEDLALLPDGRTLLISQMGTMDGSEPGSFALLDTRTETITRLPLFTEGSDILWGDPGCQEPPGAAFSPHGIDLGQRPDGSWQVLAVNHGGRESVEWFEVIEDDGDYALVWRGCAIPPHDSYMNDVAALPGGGFVATHMFPRSSPSLGPFSLALLKGMLGFDTGHVLHWDGARFHRAAGTDAPFPNGIQVSRDGKHLFINAYLSGEVLKVEFPSGKLSGSARIKGPDNSQWDAEGRLLIASHSGSIDSMSSCFSITHGACGAPFTIVALDPQTMQGSELFSHGGAPMGAATVAQQVGDYLYLGSFAGDRILRMPMPQGISTGD